MASPQEGVQGIFNDGRSARSDPVVLTIDATKLLIKKADGTTAGHWPLTDIERVPGTAMTGELRLCRGPSDSARLTVTDAEFVQDLARHLPNLKGKGRWQLKELRTALVAGALFVATVVAFLYWGLPLLAATAARLIPPESEMKFGEQLIPAVIEAFTGEFRSEDIDDITCTDEVGMLALGRLMEPVESHANAHVPFTIHVIDNSFVNAAALPGGHILVFSGMIDFADSSDELAAILAHEAGHVSARHPIEHMIVLGGASIIFSLVVGDFTGGTVIASVGQLLITNGYSQQAENEADTEAINTLLDAGISPAGLGSLMERIAEEHGDFTGALNYLSTHPSSKERAERAYAAGGSKVGKPLVSEAEWTAIKNICGDTLENQSENSEDAE